MFSKTILCFALLYGSTTHSFIIIGPGLLSNSSSNYLIDIAARIKIPEATLQVGQELCKRDYISTIATYEQIVGSFYDEPSSGYPYTGIEGMWVWIADAVDAETGVWYWIGKTQTAYMEFYSQAVPIQP